MASYAHGWNRRQTGIGYVRSKYGSDQLTGGAQAAAPFILGATSITPSAGLLVTYLSGQNFRESGVPAAFALTVRDRSQTFVSPFAAIALAHRFDTASGWNWVPDFQLGYRRSDTAGGSDFRLIAADGTVFDGNRARLAKDIATVGASITAHKGNLTFFLKYRGQLSKSWTEQGGAAGARLAF